MAAGLGYIEFATGDVLTAASANGYLASQVVMVFASAAARTSAIASPQEGMISYLKDTNSTEYYSGSAWAAIGGGASGGMTLLNSGNTTLSGSTITFNSLGGYESLLINIYGLNPSSAAAIGSIRFNTDTASNYSQFEDWYTIGLSEGRNAQSTTSITLNRFGRSYLSQTANNFWSFTVPKYARTGTRLMTYNSVDIPSAVTLTAGTAQYNGSSAITSLTVLLDTGTFSAGTCEIWGLK